MRMQTLCRYGWVPRWLLLFGLWSVGTLSVAVGLHRTAPTGVEEGALASADAPHADIASIAFSDATGAGAGMSVVSRLATPVRQTRAQLATEALHTLDVRLDTYPHDPEASLLKGLMNFGEGHFNVALRELDALLRREPRFRLAQLIRGDMLLARTQVVTGLGDSPLLAGLGPVQRDELQSLRAEARARLNAYLVRFNGRRVPRSVLALGSSVERVLLVDKRAHRLYVFRNVGPGEPPRLEQSFYVSTGKLRGNKRLRGDLRTPEGVYFVTGYIPGKRLPNKYGIGAFPVNYPNAYDRHLGKTGGGIWLHGTMPDTYSRPPRDSEGCMVLSNQDFAHIQPEIRSGVTPVIIAEHIDWITRSQWERERKRLFAVLTSWRNDWMSNDIGAYLAHYAPGFWSGKYNYRRWAAYKRRVVLGKRHQDVQFSDVSLFAYPEVASGGRQMVVADFRQHYASNNFNGDMNKRLYLTREHGVWRILYEGAGIRVSGR